jgi:hypothetical protein
MQVCINTNSYILLHAYFVLAFYINAVIYFMRISIYKDTHTRMSVLEHWHVFLKTFFFKDTHTRMSVLEHWHVFLCGANMLQRQLRALIASSLLSKTVATTYLHTVVVIRRIQVDMSMCTHVHAYVARVCDEMALILSHIFFFESYTSAYTHVFGAEKGV